LKPKLEFKVESLAQLFASLINRWRARRMRGFAAEVLGLAPNEVAGFIVRREAVRMTCLSGALWVTCQDDLQDYLLAVGQHFVPRSPGRLVVQASALSPARFLLTDKQQAANE